MSQTASVFVDTSGWAAPLVTVAPNQNDMATYSRILVAEGRQLVTTNYVLSELVALLTVRTRLSRSRLLVFTEQIRRTAHVVHIDPAIDEAAWLMLAQHSDKTWSLVDAASFIVMRQMGITEAFTGDHHFIQAGFTRLPIVV